MSCVRGERRVGDGDRGEMGLGGRWVGLGRAGGFEDGDGFWDEGGSGWEMGLGKKMG